MVFERLEKKLFLPASFCLGFSSNCFADDLNFNSNLDLFTAGCYGGMSNLECDKILNDRNDRAFNYFKHFIALKTVEFGLEKSGHLPAVKRGVRFIDDLRTFDTSYGTIYYSGNGFEIKDFMGAKDSYLDFSLDLDSSDGVEGFKINYSIRF